MRRVGVRMRVRASSIAPRTVDVSPANELSCLPRSDEHTESHTCWPMSCATFFSTRRSRSRLTTGSSDSCVSGFPPTIPRSPPKKDDCPFSSAGAAPAADPSSAAGASGFTVGVEAERLRRAAIAARLGAGAPPSPFFEKSRPAFRSPAPASSHARLPLFAAPLLLLLLSPPPPPPPPPLAAAAALFFGLLGLRAVGRDRLRAQRRAVGAGVVGVGAVGGAAAGDAGDGDGGLPRRRPPAAWAARCRALSFGPAACSRTSSTRRTCAASSAAASPGPPTAPPPPAARRTSRRSARTGTRCRARPPGSP